MQARFGGFIPHSVPPEASKTAEASETVGVSATIAASSTSGTIIEPGGKSVVQAPENARPRKKSEAKWEIWYFFSLYTGSFT